MFEVACFFRKRMRQAAGARRLMSELALRERTELFRVGLTEEGGQ